MAKKPNPKSEQTGKAVDFSKLFSTPTPAPSEKPVIPLFSAPGSGKSLYQKKLYKGLEELSEKLTKKVLSGALYDPSVIADFQVNMGKVMDNLLVDGVAPSATPTGILNATDLDKNVELPEFKQVLSADGEVEYAPVPQPMFGSHKLQPSQVFWGGIDFGMSQDTTLVIKKVADANGKLKYIPVPELEGETAHVVAMEFNPTTKTHKITLDVGPPMQVTDEAIQELQAVMDKHKKDPISYLKFDYGQLEKKLAASYVQQGNADFLGLVHDKITVNVPVLKNTMEHLEDLSVDQVRKLYGTLNDEPCKECGSQLHFTIDHFWAKDVQAVVLGLEKANPKIFPGCHAPEDARPIWRSVPRDRKLKVQEWFNGHVTDELRGVLLDSSLEAPGEWITIGDQFVSKLRMNMYKAGWTPKFFGIDKLRCVMIEMLEDFLWGVN